MRHNVNRRWVVAGAGAGLTSLMVPSARAEKFKELEWDDLIPAGLPYPQIIDEGVMDLIGDTWQPVFDEYARKFVDELDGADVKLPGFIIPLEYSGDGVTGFILAPYYGACIHVPPPPPNQLVYVNTLEPYPNDNLFDAIWVYGKLSINQLFTDVGETGYGMQAERIEIYEWT